jgi:hypothetical protein
MFLADSPFVDRRIPRHLDALLGIPCRGSDVPVEAFLEIPERRQGLDPPGSPPWPTYRRRH